MKRKLAHINARRAHYPRHRRLGAAKLTVPAVVLVAGVFTVVLAFLFLTPGAKSDNSAAADSSAVISTSSNSVAPRIPSKKRAFRVGINFWTGLAEKKGWFKEAFEPLNAEIEVVDRRVAGGAEAALFKRGDIHIGERMAYPTLQHKANGFDFVVVAASGEAPPRRATTIVRTASTVKTLADLKGKVLGAHRLGCPYFATYEALLGAGLQLDTELKKGDVRHVNITGQPAILALLSGEIEALSVHLAMPDYAQLFRDGRIREIGTALPGGQYVTNGGRALIVTTRNFANENPDLIQAYLRVYERARRYIIDEKHYDEAATISSEQFRTPKDISLFLVQDAETRLTLNKIHPDAQEAVDALKSFLHWAITNGDDFYTTKPLTDAQVEEFVDRRFFAGGQYYVDTTGTDAQLAAPLTLPKQ
ncbi:MAG: ABC transporter substrate-binding protein [Puniceicoccales bacterium]|jgi:sulfonate transport system substrate-binding protein|nr:ABC transporter substrate-binding protein [Puniceicoccales bacterium]